MVATPLGNLGDLAPRARDLLSAATVIAAEDTRTTRRLLPAGGAPRLVSLTEYNVVQRVPSLIEAAREGIVALVSEAGTPAIADPGARLVAAAHAAGVAVHPIPGPSALAAALSVSGFDTASVYFLGFLPRAAGERAARLRAAAAAAPVLVFYESPRRLSATLSQLGALLDDPAVVVCREMTKVHEEVASGRALALAPLYANTRGECTVVVQAPRDVPGDLSALREFLRDLHEAGARRAGAAAVAARRFGVTRAEAYAAWPAEPDRP